MQPKFFSEFYRARLNELPTSAGVFLIARQNSLDPETFDPVFFDKTLNIKDSVLFAVRERDITSFPSGLVYLYVVVESKPDRNQELSPSQLQKDESSRSELLQELQQYFKQNE